MDHAEFYVAALLFCIGLWGLIFNRNLLKKVIALNIVETSIYLLYISIGDLRLGADSGLWAASHFSAAVGPEGFEPMINPIPTGLVLTAIVVSVCITAFALSLIIRLYEKYGTFDIDKIRELSR